MFTFVRPRIRIKVQLLALLIVLSTTSTVSATDWVKVLGDGNLCSVNGRLCGISGMALLKKDGPTEFLVVHDRTAMPRLGIVTLSSKSVKYRPVQGTNLPVNLEAISSIPDKTGQFLALSEDGQVFLLILSDENKVTSQRLFLLPQLPSSPNMEGLSLQKLGRQMVIAWGHRGAGEQPGILYYGLLDLEKKSVTDIITKEQNTPIKVQFPSPNDLKKRHIADLKIDTSGVVWASATYDPGFNERGEDIGPFRSAVYTLGILRLSETSGVKFEEHTNPSVLWTFEGKKVEALEFVPGPHGGIAFGAEDEDLGGWIYFK